MPVVGIPGEWHQPFLIAHRAWLLNLWTAQHSGTIVTGDRHRNTRHHPRSNAREKYPIIPRDGGNDEQACTGMMWLVSSRGYAISGLNSTCHNPNISQTNSARNQRTNKISGAIELLPGASVNSVGADSRMRPVRTRRKS